MTIDIAPGCGMECLARVRVLISAFPPSIASIAHHPAVPSGSWPGAAEHQQVIGDDTEPDPALHPALTAVPAPPQSVTSLERADPSFTTRAPAKRRACRPGALLAGLPRQHDVPDPAVVRRALIGPRGKASIGDGQLRRVVEEGDVAIQRREPEVAVAGAPVAHGVVGDELPLGFLNLHPTAELRGLGQLALADDLGGCLETTHNLVRV